MKWSRMSTEKCPEHIRFLGPDIKEIIPIKGCQPSIESVAKALDQAGINVDPASGAASLRGVGSRFYEPEASP